ncbi:MAG: haloacid dehalogenase-like hydrolase [Clostridia bacterium]|nr:haloacid dehalogenase-like hydrolase [Clostridia bacterium]
MNVYDFDKTIYNFDSPSKFYFFCIKRHPKIFWHLFVSAFWGVLKSLRIIDLTRFKEKFFSFVLYLPDYKKDLELFWQKEVENINDWYFEKKQDNDVICSATPRFMMETIVEKINPKATLVCSEIDIKTAKFLPNETNCKGKNKVNKLKELGFVSFKEGYGDSKSDIPMLKMAKKRFQILSGGKVVEFDKKFFE